MLSVHRAIQVKPDDVIDVMAQSSRKLNLVL